MYCHCSQAQTFCHDFPPHAISTIPAHLQSPCICAPSATFNTIDIFQEQFKLTDSFSNVLMSSKALHVLLHLALIPSPPLQKMPLCVGRHTHHICSIAPFPPFSSYLWPPFRSRTHSESTTDRLCQSSTTHCSRQYLSVARSIPVLFSICHPQICETLFSIAVKMEEVPSDILLKTIHSMYFDIALFESTFKHASDCKDVAQGNKEGVMIKNGI